MTREYLTVAGCGEYAGTHQHLKEDTREYCHASGRWLAESTFITPKQLKEKWYGDNSRFKKKEDA